MKETTVEQACNDTGQPTTIPFHCGNECPVKGEYEPETDLYSCGYRHWCPWCGDCEFCYGKGPHDWD